MAESMMSKQQSKEELPGRPAKPGEPTPHTSSTEFLFETKYVMLNFMGLLPPEMYQGHMSTSPESVTELPLSEHATQQYHKLSKTRSLDVSSIHDVVRMKSNKRLLHVQGLQKSVDSPASDDNLNYRYAKHRASYESENRSVTYRSNSDIDASNKTSSQEGEMRSHSDHLLMTGSVSPSKMPVGHGHFGKYTYSDVSSPDDSSYIGDADDELEDTSNASSIFSSMSGGYLDLRRSVPRLSTLASQSEALDDVDGLVHSTMAALNDSADEADSIEESETKPEDGEGVDEADHAVSAQGDLVSRRSVADRSKLKLNIPCQPIELDDVLVSLHTELNSELSELETEYEQVLRSSFPEVRTSPNLPPLTPQTEAARILARIGDGVREEYETQITSTVSGLFMNFRRETTYAQFKQMSSGVIDTDLLGWRQVALLMVYGQKIMWNAVQHGQKQCGSIVDYCTQLVADVAADFIIREGGWGAVMNFDPSQSSDTQSSVECEISPVAGNYFVNTHDVTQVESETYQKDHAIEDPSEEVTENGSDNALTVRPPQATNRYAPSEGFDYAEGTSNSLDGNALQSVDSESVFSGGMEADNEEDFHVNGQDPVADNLDGTSSNTNNEGDEEVEDVFQDDTMIEDESGSNKVDSSADGKSTSATSGHAQVVDETEQSRVENDLDHINGNIPQKKAEDYHKDSIYVKQDTPTLNGSFSDINEPVIHSNITSENSGNERGNNQNGLAVDQGVIEDENSQKQTCKDMTQDTDVGQDDCSKISEESVVSDSGNTDSEADSTSSWNPVRQLGFNRVTALSLGVLALGVSVRLATLNR